MTEFTIEEQRIIGVAICFLKFELYGDMTSQKDMMEQELPFVMNHEESIHSVLEKVKEGCLVKYRT